MESLWPGKAIWVTRLQPLASFVASHFFFSVWVTSVLSFFLWCIIFWGMDLRMWSVGNKAVTSHSVCVSRNAVTIVKWSLQRNRWRETSVGRLIKFGANTQNVTQWGRHSRPAELEWRKQTIDWRLLNYLGSVMFFSVLPDSNCSSI